MRFFIAVLISALGWPPLTQAAVYKDRAWTEFFRRTNGIVACDGAFSVPLSSGRVLWLFGDSYVDCYRAGTVPCLFQVRNCAIVHDKGDLQNVRPLIGKHPGIKSFFKNVAAEDPWFWPVSGFERGGSVYVYLTSLRKAGSGPLGFARTDRDYLARMDSRTLEVAEYIALPSFNGIDFGTGFISDPDAGHVYAYGQRRQRITLDIFVARLPADAPGNQWTFWNGAEWSPDVTNAAIVASQPATSVSVCKVKDKFLLTSSQFSVGCDQGKEIYMSVSDKVTGPFTPRKKIYTIDDTWQGHYPFFYLPVVHPQFTNDKNELLVTYCINGYEPCARSCIDGRMNPDHYRPRAIRVPVTAALGDSR